MRVEKNSNVPFFRNSVRDKLHLPQYSKALNVSQEKYVFEQLKKYITDIVTEHKLQDEFLYKLLMTSTDPGIFLNLMAGWLSGDAKNRKVFDACVRVFHTLYPEVYKSIDDQEPIYKPS